MLRYRSWTLRPTGAGPETPPLLLELPPELPGGVPLHVPERFK
jgi:hypothetical protein